MDSDRTTEDESWATNTLKENPPPESLPVGWIVRKSRSQPGTFFHYNQETGEAQWEKPVQVKMSKAAPISRGPVSADIATSNQLKQSEPKFNQRAVPALKRTVEVSNAAKADLSTTLPETKKLRRLPSVEPKEVRVLHILKKHKGSRRPSSWRNPNITSTLEEAREELKGLVDVLQEVKDNPEEMRATFEELARTESDCSSAKRGGDLGFFGRKKMQPSFEQASFALEVGEMSDVVESASGVHVILRVG